MWSEWASCFLSPSVSPLPRRRPYSWSSPHHYRLGICPGSFPHKEEVEVGKGLHMTKYRKLWKGESLERTLAKLEHGVSPVPKGKKSINRWVGKAEQKKVFPYNERNGPKAAMLEEGCLLVSFHHGKTLILRAAYLFLNIFYNKLLFYFKLKPNLFLVLPFGSSSVLLTLME